jgi:aromatic ring-opening dioxygenase LigB subunit
MKLLMVVYIPIMDFYNVTKCRCKMGTNAILKMEAACSSETLVPVYKPHDIIFQNTVSVIFIDKIYHVYLNAG